MRKDAGTFKPDLGWVPFHLGCNALAVHPNCALCHPVLGPAKPTT